MKFETNKFQIFNVLNSVSDQKERAAVCNSKNYFAFRSTYIVSNVILATFHQRVFLVRTTEHEILA